ncbi:MAG: ATP phosphoribosyltransferase regulatory subunit, partial [Clostridium sp.]
IESKNYSALDTILDRLEQTPAVLAIRRLPRLFGGEEVLQQAADLCSGEDTVKTLGYLKDLYLALREIGLGEKLIIDLGLVQRNDYYSDIIFSGYVEGSGDAVLTGGRYDHLLEAFGAPMPAVGFGINVDAITKLMLESGNVQTRKPADVLIHGDDGFEMKALKHSAFLLKGGLRCENSVFPSRQEALEYARSKKIPRVDYVSENVQTVSVWEKGGKV